jgi:hypothetical protein
MTSSAHCPPESLIKEQFTCSSSQVVKVHFFLVFPAHETERMLLQEHLLPLGVDLVFCLSFLADAAEWFTGFHWLEWRWKRNSTILAFEWIVTDGQNQF